MLYNRYGTYIDDQTFPLIGRNLTSVAGRLDYNFDECSIDFSPTARYPEEPICITTQMTHSKVMNTQIGPHVHWYQEESAIPNWLLAYRFYKNGAQVPEFILVPHTGENLFSYQGPKQAQITLFPYIDPPSLETISANFDARLYRDSFNASGLFAGPDPYSKTVKAKNFDFHVIKNKLGSAVEFSKL